MVSNPVDVYEAGKPVSLEMAAARKCYLLGIVRNSFYLIWSSYTALKNHIDITLSSVAFKAFKVAK